MLRTIYTSNIALLAISVYCSRTFRWLDLIVIYRPYLCNIGTPVFPAEKPTSSDYVLESTGFSVGIVVIKIYRDSRPSAWSYCALKWPVLAASRSSRTKLIIFINALCAQVTIKYVSHASFRISQGVVLVSFYFIPSQSLWYITLNTTKSALWFAWIRSSESLCLTFTDTEYDRPKYSLLRSRYLYAHHNGAWYCYGRLGMCMRSHECYASFSLLVIVK